MVLYGHFVMSHWAGERDESGLSYRGRARCAPYCFSLHLRRRTRCLAVHWRCGGPLRCPFLPLSALRFNTAAATGQIDVEEDNQKVRRRQCYILRFLSPNPINTESHTIWDV